MANYTLVSKDFPMEIGDEGAIVHNGTGAIKYSYRLVQPWTVPNAGEPHRQLHFAPMDYSITVLSLEIDTTDAPNWFGVSFRQGVQAFDSVNLVFHPSPGHAGMEDGSYQARTGPWPRLFRYAEMFGRQIAVAGKNQIVVVPFFNNASFGTGGLFTPNWKDLVTQALQIASSSSKAAAAASAGAAKLGPFGAARAEFEAAIAPPVNSAAELKNVVLSDFSVGRTTMNKFRQSAAGLGSQLREIWDFDGNGVALPASSSGVRVLTYDQVENKENSPNNFHVPAKRWVEFHGPVLANKQGASVHNNIPDMLAWHTATVSGVG